MSGFWPNFWLIVACIQFVCMVAAPLLAQRWYGGGPLEVFAYLGGAPVLVAMVVHRAYTEPRRTLAADYDECLRLIEYQPKPEAYWQLKEIEWDRET